MLSFRRFFYVAGGIFFALSNGISQEIVGFKSLVKENNDHILESNLQLNGQDVEEKELKILGLPIEKYNGAQMIKRERENDWDDISQKLKIAKSSSLSPTFSNSEDAFQYPPEVFFDLLQLYCSRTDFLNLRLVSKAYKTTSQECFKRLFSKRWHDFNCREEYISKKFIELVQMAQKLGTTTRVKLSYFSTNRKEVPNGKEAFFNNEAVDLLKFGPIEGLVLYHNNPPGKTHLDALSKTRKSNNQEEQEEFPFFFLKKIFLHTDGKKEWTNIDFLGDRIFKLTHIYFTGSFSNFIKQIEERKLLLPNLKRLNVKLDGNLPFFLTDSYEKEIENNHRIMCQYMTNPKRYLSISIGRDHYSKESMLKAFASYPGTSLLKKISLKSYLCFFKPNWHAALEGAGRLKAPFCLNLEDEDPRSLDNKITPKAAAAICAVLREDNFFSSLLPKFGLPENLFSFFKAVAPNLETIIIMYSYNSTPYFLVKNKYILGKNGAMVLKKSKRI